MKKQDKERNNPNIEKKKAMVLDRKKKSSNSLIIGIVLIVMVAAGAGFYLLKGMGSTDPVAGKSNIQMKNGQIEFAVNHFDDGNARHFHYEDPKSGLTINYFILKSSDGIIRAAFDACDVCWPAGKGYVQEGDNMICRNCGRRFESTSINEVKGGCNPAPLDRSISGDKVVIRVEDIEKGAGYFNFSEKA